MLLWILILDDEKLLETSLINCNKEYTVSNCKKGLTLGPVVAQIAPTTESRAQFCERFPSNILVSMKGHKHGIPAESGTAKEYEDGQKIYFFIFIFY